MELYQNRALLQDTIKTLNDLDLRDDGRFRSLATYAILAVQNASGDGKATPELIEAANEFKQKASVLRGWGDALLCHI